MTPYIIMSMLSFICNIIQVPGHMNLKGYEKLQKLNERYVGSGWQYMPGQSRNVTYISRLQVDYLVLISMQLKNPYYNVHGCMCDVTNLKVVLIICL